MQIRKLFKVEGAHIVRNCSTNRCRKSIHGHSVIIEVFLTSDKLDNGGMIVDFSLIKKNIGQWIDSFDHCMLIWKKDKEEYKNDMKKWCDRWIELPISPSAENLALYICYVINKMIEATEFNNGEGNVVCSKVIYHETSTGYAEATINDIDLLPIDLSTIYSIGVLNDWSDELYNFFNYTKKSDEKCFINPKVEKQC